MNYNNEQRTPKYYNREEFKGIQNKEYINTDASTAFKIAQKAMAEGVEFSAKYDGAKSAVTVDGVKDSAFVAAVRSEFNIPAKTTEKSAQYFGQRASQQEKPAQYFNRETAQKDRSVKYFNREGFKNIQNKTFLQTDSKTAYSISVEAQKHGIEHSVKFDGDRSTVTLDGVKDKTFADAVRNNFDVHEKTRNEKTREKPAQYFGQAAASRAKPTQYFGQSAAQQEKPATYFNKESFKDIQNKTFIQTDSKTAFAISKEAQKHGIEHSARYDGAKSAVTVDGVKDRGFVDAIKNMTEWAGKVQVKEAQNRSKNNGAR